jgi:hypothetical protein
MLVSQNWKHFSSGLIAEKPYRKGLKYVKSQAVYSMLCNMPFECLLQVGYPVLACNLFSVLYCQQLLCLSGLSFKYLMFFSTAIAGLVRIPVQV